MRRTRVPPFLRRIVATRAGLARNPRASPGPGGWDEGLALRQVLSSIGKPTAEIVGMATPSTSDQSLIGR